MVEQMYKNVHKRSYCVCSRIASNQRL